jgi:hypothetical protein
MESVKKWAKIIAAVVALIGIGAAVGYYLAPTKTVTVVEVKEKIITVEKKVTEKSKKEDKVTIIVETILPDGTRRKETKIVDKGMVTVDTTTDINTVAETEKKKQSTTEKKSDDLLVYLLGSARLNDWGSGPSYGVGVGKRVLGPFWLGGYGTTKSDVGITLGVSF